MKEMGRLRAIALDIWKHTGFQKYVRNTGWIFGAKVFTLGVSFIATLYVARTLGPTNFGQLSYATSFVALFGFIASLGTETILYRDLIRHPERSNLMLGTAFSIRLLAGICAAIISVCLAFLLVEDDVSSFLVLILSGTFVLSAFQVILFDFQSRADSKYPSIIAVAISIILNLLKVSVIATGNGVIYLASILLLEAVLYAIAYLYIYMKIARGSVLRWRFDKGYALSLLKDSAPLIALTGFAMIYARIDQVFIKHLIDATAVGVYDAAVRVAELWTFLPGILLAALTPAIVNAKSVSDQLYNQRLGRLGLLITVIAVAAASGVTLLAPLIIRILYGEAFMAGVPVLQVYVWSLIGTSLGILISYYLITENFRKILAFMGLVPMLANVILNILWIPAYGIMGAAYATLISYSLMPLMLLFFRPTRERLVAILRSF
jgi:O-antigen/teichoic acid export membrane protein